MKARHGMVVLDRMGRNGRYFLDDVEVTKAEYDEAFPDKLKLGEEMTPGVHLPSGWPMISDSMAVHPDQIPEVLARNKRHGINIEYLPTGQPVLRDAAQKRELMRAEGFFDKGGAYGHS